ncbi:hypothetical protein WMF37_44155 [Sorangium sp. So ce291]|uniref:hypothetical protein n=1 Tax=Sorangium sp. So ce291 TaxID=3133294 RepID=UPI003F5ECDE2
MFAPAARVRAQGQSRRRLAPRASTRGAATGHASKPGVTFLRVDLASAPPCSPWRKDSTLLPVIASDAETASELASGDSGEDVAVGPGDPIEISTWAFRLCLGGEQRRARPMTALSRRVRRAGAGRAGLSAGGAVIGALAAGARDF